MKKFVLVLAVLAVAVGMAFAEATCARCGRTYYGNSCSYCAGYSAGMSDFYKNTVGGSADKTCKPYGTSSTSAGNVGNLGQEQGNQTQMRNVNQANCYDGYNQAMKDASENKTSKN